MIEKITDDDATHTQLFLKHFFFSIDKTLTVVKKIYRKMTKRKNQREKKKRKKEKFYELDIPHTWRSWEFDDFSYQSLFTFLCLPISFHFSMSFLSLSSLFNHQFLSIIQFL